VDLHATVGDKGAAGGAVEDPDFVCDRREWVVDWVDWARVEKGEDGGGSGG
jgi:hypothetical protein